MVKKLLLLLTLATFSYCLINAQPTPVKRALLEQHTGAWCGWCVDGTVKMDELLELYPDKVIGVKFHNGDSMAIPEQEEIGNALGLTGFPTGSVNRLPYNNAIFISRTAWKAAVEAEIGRSPKVDLELVYSLNETTLEFDATLTCRILQDINEEILFNLFIVEDSVSGSGTGWNQSNYYSKNASYPTHPYYNLANPIVGYQHMKVMRALLGGSWGALSCIPNNAKSGETYYHSFKTKLNSLWRIPQLSFVGVAHSGGTSKEILNSVVGVTGTPKPASLALVPESDLFDVAKSGVAHKRAYTVTNYSSQEITVKAIFSPNAGFPGDWTLGVENGNEFTIPANDSKLINVQCIPGNTYGFGKSKFVLFDKNNPESIGVAGEIACASEELEKFEVVSATNAPYLLQTVLQETSHSGYYQIEPEYFTPYADKYINKKVVIYNTGAAGGLTSADANAIINCMKKDVPTFVVGNLTVLNFNAYKQMNFFGAQYTGTSREGYGQAPWTVWFQGFDNDIVTGDFGKNTEGSLIKYLLGTMIIIDKGLTRPMIAFQKHPDSLIAVRTYYNNKTKAILMGVCPWVIVSEKNRNKLISNCIDWLEGKLVEGVDDDIVKSGDGAIMMASYPNPFTSSTKVNIQINSELPQFLNIYLIDELGRTVQCINSDYYHKGNHEIKLGENLPSGYYRIIVETNYESLSYPLIKTN